MVGAMRMRQRLDALENQAFGGFAPYVQIIQKVGQTERGAITDFEAEHGPLAPEAQILLLVIRAPERGSN